VQDFPTISSWFSRKGRNYGKPFQTAAPEKNDIPGAEPGVGAQVAVFFFGHPEVKGAGDPPSSKHHFSGDGLGQALAFPGEMAAHGSYGLDRIDRINMMKFIE